MSATLLTRAEALKLAAKIAPWVRDLGFAVRKVRTYGVDIEIDAGKPLWTVCPCGSVFKPPKGWRRAICDGCASQKACACGLALSKGALRPFRIRERRGRFKDDGPQWGAFHPGGDEAIVIPIEKWDSLVLWETLCCVCLEPVWVGRGTIEVLGPYHAGCFGYPACGCKASHRGDCK